MEGPAESVCLELLIASERMECNAVLTCICHSPALQMHMRTRLCQLMLKALPQMILSVGFWDYQLMLPDFSCAGWLS